MNKSISETKKQNINQFMFDYKQLKRIKNFFDNIDQIKIQILPELLIDFKTKGKWNDKHTLLLAVLIRDVVEAIDRDAIGMMFWSPRSDINEINSALEELQYFEYYEQAMDIINS